MRANNAQHCILAYAAPRLSARADHMQRHVCTSRLFQILKPVVHGVMSATRPGWLRAGPIQDHPVLAGINYRPVGKWRLGGRLWRSTCVKFRRAS